MKMDFKNYNKPGIFPEYFKIQNEISAGEFKKTLKYDNIYDENEPAYVMTFNYRFQFTFRNKIIGTAYVYRGGFNIDFTKPYGDVYKSSHCNHFSMPMCQHFTNNGEFTQFFIDRISEVLETKYNYIVEDEASATIRYLKIRK